VKLTHSGIQYEIDLDNKQIIFNTGVTKSIQSKRWQLLTFLAQNTMRVITLDELKKKVWMAEVGDEAICSQAREIRKDFDNENIIEVGKQGLKFNARFISETPLDGKHAIPSESHERSNSYIVRLLGAHLQHAKSEAWFFGTNFHLTTEQFRVEILDALKRGVNIYYIVFSPKSVLLPHIANSFNMPEERLENFCDGTIKNLTYIQKQALEQNASGKLEYKLYESIPYFRAYFLDPFLDGHSYIVPYLMGANPADIPGYLIPSTDSRSVTRFEAVAALWGKLP
jgi:DNA-binding winged helix-turn-helix (wHTH) protein